MPRLPQPGGDEGNWGVILNDYLAATHATDGSLKPGVVGSTQLQADAVTSTQLADNAVTTAALAPGAVSATELSNDTVAESKLTQAVRDKLNAVAGGGSTNLTTSTSGSTVTINSDTGTDATIPAATTSAAGILSAPDKTKLDSVATGAQVNTVTSVASKTGAVTLVKGDVGLGNVDNTTDLNKPVSTATQTALNLKVNTSSLAPVATSGDYADLTNRPTFSGTNTGDQTLSITGNSLSISGSSGNTISIPTGGGGGNTNLSTSTTATTLTVLSDTGTSATLPAATTSVAGVLTAADKTKLNSIATSATQNATDASLRDRATHTGTQAISTVTNLQTTLDAKANTSSLATVATTGSYTDLTNRPTIPAVTGTNTGDQTLAYSAGTLTISGGNGNSVSIPTGGAVTSVAGRTGAVTLTKSDIGLGNVDNTSDVNKPVSTATQNALNGKQALDSDLTAIAALTTTSYGRSLLTTADAAALRTALGVTLSPVIFSAETPTVGTTGTDRARGDRTIIEARMRVGAAPAGSALTAQVQHSTNGSSWTTVTTLSIAAGVTTETVQSSLSQAQSAGHLLRLNVTAVGSTTPASDVVVEVIFA